MAHFSLMLHNVPSVLPGGAPSSSFQVPSSPHHDLQSMICLIKESISLAESTLNSVHEFFKPCKIQDLCSCPFDSRHRMPPESLFRHYLVCSSSPGIIDLTTLESLCYPTSLKHLHKPHFFESALDLNTELCFSLNEFGDFGTNFFYNDCPGVVGTSGQDKIFMIPGVLAAECANFKLRTHTETENARMLPSEHWALGNEVESWNDCPSSYSQIALRAILCIKQTEASRIKKWLISNSPRRGIVLDVFMMEHIFLLLNLCLKAVEREAFQSFDLICGSEGFSFSGHLTLECPVLVEALTWLGAQISILYGEADGRRFALDMFKQSILQAGLISLLFSAAKEKIEPTSGDAGAKELGSHHYVQEMKADGEPPSDNLTPERNMFSWGSSDTTVQIFISQVAAAVAALHERASLEQKIKEIRYGRSLPRVQLFKEHSCISTRAIQERERRTDYRPVLEHDGLIWQRPQNQHSAKHKSREELLAEERDYKRRRMSYRGKKAKRTPTEVLHDIIEEHMEEIIQVGGIGCFVKGSLGFGSDQEPVSLTDMNNCREPLAGSKQVSSHGHKTSARFNSNNPSYQLNDRVVSKGKHETKYSRSLKGYRMEDNTLGKHSDFKDHNISLDGNIYEVDDSPLSCQSRHVRCKPNDYKSNRSQERRRDLAYQEQKSMSRGINAFEDRYDPAGSCETYEDDNYDISSHIKYYSSDTEPYFFEDRKHPKAPRRSNSQHQHDEL